MNESPGRSTSPKPDRIPDELERFVRRDTYALLIKGRAGTGKTTLSLTILKTLGQASNFFYISTRISPRQLFTYYPWVEHFVQALKPQQTSENEEQVYKMSMFEDARLDEPESLFERITNELMDVKAPIIIIDSWDAIASFMDKEARLNNERVLQTWRERAGAKLIFISEDTSYSTLDFLVDGIVELDQSVYNSCRLRQIKIIKLRGVKIVNQIYNFSLNNSIFTSFKTYNPSEYSLNKIGHRLQDDLPKRKNYLLKPYSVKGAARIRTGYPELDEVLEGGLPRKGIVILRFDPSIHIIAVTTFLAKIMANFVMRNNPVLVQPIGNANPQTMMVLLRSYLGYSPSDNVFGRLWSDVEDPEVKQPNVLTQLALIKKGIEFARKRYPESVMLSVFNCEYLKSLENELDQMNMLSFLNEKTDLSIIVGTEIEAVPSPVEAHADLKLEISLINGSLFLRPISPVGPIFGLTPYNKGGIPRLNLRVLV
ncbi:MAG TPA: ATPase domain-containing protein [Nitrososphaeraceae archaeon]|nr:ATPase domain-containing protein [Nitrososphaeraceae archaeon]